jgi:rRNA maturation RNase YbeY
MILYNYLTEFKIDNEEVFSSWLTACIELYDYKISEVSYIFCNDEYLLDLNKNHLSHDTLTDIITFDYTESKSVCADLFISVERIKHNATLFKVTFDRELMRVMVHGLLHCMGFDDKTEISKSQMRKEEDKCLKLFNECST